MDGEDVDDDIDIDDIYDIDGDDDGWLVKASLNF